MVLSRGRAACFAVLSMALALPGCFGADSSDGDGDDDDSGGEDGSGAMGGTGPGSGGDSGSATGGSSNTSGSGGSSGKGGSGGSAAGAGGSGGNVVPPPAGNGGNAGGGAGGAGSAGMSGSAGASGGTPGALGSACTTAADCDSGFCLTADSAELEGAGPAGGLCTQTCADQAACDAAQTGSLCVPFTDTISFCLEECAPGSASEPKCQTRPDMTCSGVGTSEGTTACTTIDDCPLGQVCIAAVEGDPTLCSPVISACVPTCRGDFECASGQYCDQYVGMCLPGTPPAGQPIGSVCDPAAATDPCSGLCLPVSETEGMCSAACGFSTTPTGCGFDGTTTADATCLFLPGYVDAMDVGIGDAGYCGPLCDCNDDCLSTGWGCFDIEVALGEGAGDYFGRAGVCRALADGEVLTDGLVCP